MTSMIERRARRLKAMLRDVSSWSIRSRVSIADWRDGDGLLEAGRPWASELRVHTLRQNGVQVPASWALGETRLELADFGLGEIVLESDGREPSRFAINDLHSRFRPPSERFDITLRVSPVRAPSKDSFTGCVALGRVGEALLTRVDRDVEQFCVLVDLLIATALSTPHKGLADELLAGAEQALQAIEWPTAAADVRASQADSEHLTELWNDLEISQSYKGLTENQRASVRRSLTHVKDTLGELRGHWPSEQRIGLIGHAHIDIAWLWPMSVTQPAAVGHFGTALSQLDRYPQFLFGQSSGQLYEMLEQSAQADFNRVKGYVAEGRWELLGGMWVEADTVLLAGESLVRQILHGQQYFRSRFGRRSKVAWLPDTFGFSGALPQLFVDAGMPYFYTQKLRFNDTNQFPYDLCHWIGIDGSSVLAYLAPGPFGYRGMPDPKSLIATSDAFRERDRHPSTFVPLGHQAGMGPTDDDILRATQLREMPGLPSVEFVTALQFFEGAARADGLPGWEGELYLEARRGAYTTHTATKILHRAAEWALVDAEAAASLSALHAGRLPVSLTETWTTLLEQQTHDIVTGATIAESQDSARSALSGVLSTASKIAGGAASALAQDLVGLGDKTGIFLLNPTLTDRPFRAFLPGRRDVGQRVEGGSIIATDDMVPPLGARWLPGGASPGVRAEGLVLENDHLRMRLRHDGTIASIYHHRTGREMLAGPGNALQAFLDRPDVYDAQELSPDYERFPLAGLTCANISTSENGPYRAALRVDWTFRDSAIRQDIRLWSNSARIDIATKIDWREKHVLLRSYFPVAVRAEDAVTECAFGTTRRPMSRSGGLESARFEVPVHRFLDISDGLCGAALLNNGRYGHGVRDGVASITLMRSPLWPDPHADEGTSEFTYSIFPHPGDWFQGGVLAEAADLNALMPASACAGGTSGSWQQLLVTGGPIALSALKRAETRDGIVLRLYEPTGSPAAIRCEPPPGWQLSAELNILEEPVGPGKPDTALGPYQVRTWLISHFG